MYVSIGNCYICNRTARKSIIKNHIYRDHYGKGEFCYLIKAEATDDYRYWLYFSIRTNAALSVLDSFLRKIWCECCNHISLFHINDREINKLRYINEFDVGSTLAFSYDLGITTKITVEIVDIIERNKQKNDIQLIARNAPMYYICVHCGREAESYEIVKRLNFCSECAKYERGNLLRALANSPRCGICEFDGIKDIWSFNKNKT